MRDSEFYSLFALTAAAFVAALVFAEDHVNVLLDAGWVLGGLVILAITRRWFPLSPLLYRLLVLHSLVLIAGGYWTYEKMPIGVWLKEIMRTQRNHYDRFGHFLQGFVPAIIFRELYIRCSPVKSGGWLAWFVFASCLAFSAFFEFLEWWATLLSGDSPGHFLGYQGDIWDTQWDMLWCVIGAILSLAVLWYPHNWSLRGIGIGAEAKAA